MPSCASPKRPASTTRSSRPRLVDAQRRQPRRRRQQLHGGDRRRRHAVARHESHAVAGGEQERLRAGAGRTAPAARNRGCSSRRVTGRVDGRQVHRDRDRVRRQHDARVRTAWQLQGRVVGGEERLAGQGADGDDVVVVAVCRRVTSSTVRPVAAATSARSAPSYRPAAEPRADGRSAPAARRGSSRRRRPGRCAPDPR